MYRNNDCILYLKFQNNTQSLYLQSINSLNTYCTWLMSYLKKMEHNGAAFDIA